MSRAAVTFTLSDTERRELESLARCRKTAQGLARRARIIPAAAQGLENKAIVEHLGIDSNTVGKWRRRFAHGAPTASMMSSERAPTTPQR